MKCLRGIIQVPIIDEKRLCAQVSIKRGGFGIRDPVLRSPAASLYSSFATACTVGPCGTTPGLDVGLSSVSPSTTTQRVAPRSTRRQSCLSKLCDAQTLGFLMQKASQSHWISLNSIRSRGGSLAVIMRVVL